LRDRGDYDGLVWESKENVNPRVTKVVPGSAAHLAGFRAGDEIVGLNGLPPQLSDLGQVFRLGAPRREALSMQIKRDGQNLELTLPGG
jgi:C-terminal processing protease CtpA/Prc